MSLHIGIPSDLCVIDCLRFLGSLGCLGYIWVLEFGFMVWGFMVQGVRGFGFWVWGLGFGLAVSGHGLWSWVLESALGFEVLHFFFLGGG